MLNNRVSLPEETNSEPMVPSSLSPTKTKPYPITKILNTLSLQNLLHRINGNPTLASASNTRTPTPTPTPFQKPHKMQAAIWHFTPSLPQLKLTTTNKPLASPWKTTPQLRTKQRPLIKVSATPHDTPTVDYNSKASVFPAEACETVGGDACDVEMYPEVKLSSEAKRNTAKKTTSETVDRDYLEYDSPKTVFPGEACDDLGGEFCDPEYQKGVY